MAEPATIWTVLPVLAGGIIGIAGTLGSAALSHHLTAGTERDKLRREKIEQILTLLYQHAHWIDRKKAILAFKEPGEVGEPPLPHAVSLVCIYFPEFSVEIREIAVKSAEYELWIIDFQTKRLNGELNKENSLAGYKEMYQGFASKLSALTVAIEKAAAKLP